MLESPSNGLSGIAVCIPERNPTVIEPGHRTAAQHPARKNVCDVLGVFSWTNIIEFDSAAASAQKEKTATNDADNPAEVQALRRARRTHCGRSFCAQPIKRSVPESTMPNNAPYNDGASDRSRLSVMETARQRATLSARPMT